MKNRIYRNRGVKRLGFKLRVTSITLVVVIGTQNILRFIERGVFRVKFPWTQIYIYNLQCYYCVLPIGLFFPLSSLTFSTCFFYETTNTLALYMILLPTVLILILIIQIIVVLVFFILFFNMKCFSTVIVISISSFNHLSSLYSKISSVLNYRCIRIRHKTVFI